MIRTVDIKRRAFTDVEGLGRFVRDRSGPSAAEGWRDALLDRMQSLSQNAEMWPLTDDEELSELGVRELLFRRSRFVYRIFFRIEGEAVLILRIRSASQDQLSPSDL